MGILINIIIVVLVLWFLAQRMMPAKGVDQIDGSELKKLLRSKQHQLIDVRTPQEFNIDKIKGFKNIPVNEIRHRLNEINKDKNVVLLCRSGARSNRAAKILKKQGYTKLTNVRGGIITYSR